jgi:sugar phosphate isomerase/epimerase
MDRRRVTAKVRLGLQDRFAPGGSLRDKFEHAREYGFDALELSVDPIASAREALRDRVTVSAICGGYRGWLIDPDAELRRAASEDLAQLVDLAGALGCGCVVVPIWGRTRNLPNTGTGRTRADDEAMFVEAMSELAARAERAGSRLYIEPINRYQNDVCVTIADALRLRALIGSAAVRVMADVFHMNIEEADLGEALLAAGEWLAHIHLADSNRLEPGMGHLDLRPVFAALGRVGYEGFASFELAGLSGDPAVALPRSVEHVRAAMRDALVA